MRWKKGQSGNPKGRPRGQTLREELRARLAASDPKRPEGSRFAAWATALIEEAEAGIRDRLDLIRFLEGSSPPEVIDKPDEEQPPRIAIPGSPRHKGRRPAAKRARDGEPTS